MKCILVSFLGSTLLFAQPATEKSATVMYKCSSSQNKKMTVLENPNSEKVPYVLKLDAPKGAKVLNLISTKSKRHTILSELFQFEGFVKIVWKKNYVDTKLSSKNESLLVMIDPVKGDESGVKYTASVNWTIGVDGDKQTVKEKFLCDRVLKTK